MTSLAAWQKQIEQYHPRKIELGLDRIQHIADKLACQRFSCPVITVAGTNGKGTCVATMANIAKAAKLLVGTYTSPHLLKFNERIQVNGIPVADALLCDAFEQIEAVRGGTPLTFFEFTTLAALIIFQQAALDLLLLEVGMGGRLDAVNIVDPDVAVITSIAFDHENFLGNTLEKIAKEKAGIARTGKPLIVSSSVDEELHDFFDKVDARVIYSSSYDLREDLPKTRYCKESVDVGIVALQQLPQFNITQSHLQKGLQDLFVPGRMHELSKRPAIVVDVAHNAQAFNEMIEQLMTLYPRINDWHAVFTCKAEKDIKKIVEEVVFSAEMYSGGIIRSWHLIDLPDPAIDIKKIATAFDRENIPYSVKSDPLVVVNDLHATIPADQGIIIFGTFLLVKILLDTGNVNRSFH